MEALLKQVNEDIEEITKTIKSLRYKRATTKHSSTVRNINLELYTAESILADLKSTKAEIEEYIKTRSEDNA